MTYAFDALGFLQFEQMCALLLEHEAGVDPGAWRGEADACRSVLSGTALGAPLGDGLEPPMLVQCAWLRRGDDRELADVVSGLASDHPEDVAVAGSFVLMSNVQSPPDFAAAVARRLGSRTLPVRVMGPAELTERIDAHSEVRRAMPSLLGLRDLTTMIDPVVADRSTLDRTAAEALAPVFVPTDAHRQALRALDAHGFAVLTGPPEMGKTAMARMIGLAVMTTGWEAHECVAPEGIWRLWERDRSQLFIADDAFGSTEYSPDAAERWAREMDRILRTLDDHHWLIWTSRPTPLRTGLARLHRERGAERFPAPGEVLVDAGRLDPAEKTLILFRHAKAADLPLGIRSAIRGDGARIVGHRHFTPERIRRLIARLAARQGELVDLAPLTEAELSHSTEAMALSFAALSDEHRDLLIAMLDTPPGPVTERDLTDALRRHHNGGLQRAPADLVDRLTDHFLRVLA